VIEWNREKLVRQRSFLWKQLNRLLGNAKYQFAHLNFKQVIKFFTLMVGGMIFVALWCWHWQLLLATSTGIGLMFMVYWLQVTNWPSNFLRWWHLLTGQHRNLTVAVGSGAIGALITYIGASIWANSENRWLALGAILQGLATLLTLTLISGIFWARKTDQLKTNFEEILRDLTDVIPLKRLIAVRKVTQLLSEQSLTKDEIQQVGEYLRVMLSSESELIIQDAIWSALEVWDGQDLKIPEQPLTIPLQNLIIMKE
jgi:hypothetical protein